MKPDTLILLAAAAAAAWYFTKGSTTVSQAPLNAISQSLPPVQASSTVDPTASQLVNVDVPMYGSGIDIGTDYYFTLGAIYSRMVELNRRYSTSIGLDHPSGWNAWLIQANPGTPNGVPFPDPVVMFGSNDIWISPTDYWAKMGPWVRAHQSATALTGLGGWVV